jgi:predicted amidohydrolase YtcJ
VTGVDLLVTGGPVLGPDGRPRYGQAVLVQAGRIVAVVPDTDAVASASTAANVLDLQGRLLLPGFVDAHAHPVWGGLERLSCDLLEAPRTAQAYQRAIAATAAAHPEWPWISGGGWSFEAFPGGFPTAELIDAVVRDRPVVLFNRDHHGVWVNSRAMQEAGIGPETSDPVDGRIERDASGRPTGMLHEGAAALVTSLLPDPSPELLDAALTEGRAQLLPLGVTGWVDAILGAYAGQPDPTPAYLRAAAAGRLDVSVAGALWWDRSCGPEQIVDLVARRHEAASAGFSAPQVKIMVDGIIENGTAAMVEDYLGADGHPTGERGLSFVSRDDLLRAVPALEAAGFAVHMHAIGDRAVRDGLDAVAAAVAERETAGRDPLGVPHQVAHLQVVRPEDVERFAALGVVANAQALWACHEPQMTELTLPTLGEPRAAWQYPFGAIARSRGRLALGSDWPVSSADPWAQVHVAVSRTAPDGEPGEPLLPSQALTLAGALTAGTAGSAFAAGLRGVGTLAPGARADLVVASVDPFLLPPAALAEVCSDLVLLAGQVVAADGHLV